MTPRQITVLACRLLAVYLFVISLDASLISLAFEPLVSWIGGTGGYAMVANNDIATISAIVLMALVPIARLFLAVMLWRRAGNIAAIMFGHDLQDHEMEPDLGDSPGTTQRTYSWTWRPTESLHIGFALFGMFLLISGVPNAFGYIGQLMYMRQVTGSSVIVDAWPFVQLSMLAVQIVLGFYLLFAGKSFARLIMRVKGFASSVQTAP